MKTDLIRADYATLDQIASTFDQQSEVVDKIYQSVSRYLDILRNEGWKSDAATVFYHEMDEDMLPALGRLTSALTAGGETTREIIRIMRDAEEEAANVLKNADRTLTPSSVAGFIHEHPQFPKGRMAKVVNAPLLTVLNELDPNDPYVQGCAILAMHPNFAGMLEHCNPDLNRVWNELWNIAQGGSLQGYLVASELMKHFLGGALYDDNHRVPVIINPTYIVGETENGEAISGRLALIFRDILTTYGLAPATVLNGSMWPPNNSTLLRVSDEVEQATFQIDGDWGQLHYRFSGEFVRALGESDFVPAGQMQVTYEYDRAAGTIRLIVTQPVELHDRYDWRGDPIALNSETGLVRIYPIAGDPAYGDLPAVEINPSNNTLIRVLDVGEEVASGGFIPMSFPPDSPNRGGIADLLGRSQGNGTVFGNPDHPNPINLALEQYEVGLRRIDYYAGDFHGLEARGSAAPFHVYSPFMQTVVYDLPIVVGADGTIAVVGEPTPIETTWSPLYPLDGNPILIPVSNLAEVGYVPSEPDYETDTQSH